VVQTEGEGEDSFFQSNLIRAGVLASALFYCAVETVAAMRTERNSMPKKKPEPKGASTARSRKFRVRRLNQQRAANEIFYRNLLQRFYEARSLEQSNWVTVDEFFTESLAPLIDKPAFVGGLKHLTNTIEVGTVLNNGESIQIVRPRYFLVKT